jgi:2-oxoglutarate ferredoxin oxidoreductase subunit alpha
MSPATGIMAHLASLSGRYPLVVEQAEDEIAAANMVVDASFAGVRAMTTTGRTGISVKPLRTAAGWWPKGAAYRPGGCGI